ncbi:MAG: M23 family metallopeptidase [Anaerolineales bacterium]|nr:M23 family metallopeptidase [Anaerolineales bacterium]MCB9144978.1 M23 family metallopeptidase [Anaerolineales bacterium]
MSVKRLLASAFLLLLAACSNPLMGAQPTEVIPFDALEQPQTDSEALITPSPQPFQFSLPTPGAEPITNWRPPLYPVPWAVGPYDHFYFTRPIAADQKNWPTADYRYGGIFFGRNIVHTGVDIPSPEGTPIMAAGPGTVVWAGWGLFRETPDDRTDPYGLAVAIRHDFGFNDQQLFTVYAHMSEMNVIVGQHVETGEVIGFVGSTGATTGPHVHFEVRFPSNSFFYTYNPELWIAPPQGWGVLAGRIMNEKGEPLQQMELLVAPENASRTFTARTYGKKGAINSDPYYQENFVLGDLPAGIYKVTFKYDDIRMQTWVEIFPGQVTYFTYKHEEGFTVAPPPAPELDFVPENLPATPTSVP